MVYKHHNQCFMVIASVKIQLCYKDRGGGVCEDVAIFFVPIYDVLSLYKGLGVLSAGMETE